MAILTKNANLSKSLHNLFISKKEPISLVHFITTRCNARSGFCFINFAEIRVFLKMN